MRIMGKCDDAVSSVIGVTMLVALTVIMVSMIAVSVYAFKFPSEVPQARIVVVEATGDTDAPLYKNTIILKHKGGDSLFENNTKIIISGKGFAYTGAMPSGPAVDIRATYTNLAGENCLSHCDNEIVEGDSWDAGETITLYGSDGNDLYLYGWHNNADSRWKIDDGSTVSVTIIDTITNEVIAVAQATVNDA